VLFRSKFTAGFKSKSSENSLRNTSPSSAERTILLKHLLQLSEVYQGITSKATSGSAEAEFLKLLNMDETLRLLSLANPHLPPPSLTKSSSGRTFSQYAPKVIAWIGAVLSRDIVPLESPLPFLPSLLADGEILCTLAIKLYPKISCHLLSKGPEFAVHRVVFFLELCKSLGIKLTLLFRIEDLIISDSPEIDDNIRIKSALMVLRTLCAFERHARKKGWKGPALELDNIKASSTPTATPLEIRKKGTKKRRDLVPYEPESSFMNARDATKEAPSPSQRISPTKTRDSLIISSASLPLEAQNPESLNFNNSTEVPRDPTIQPPQKFIPLQLNLSEIDFTIEPFPADFLALPKTSSSNPLDIVNDDHIEVQVQVDSTEKREEAIQALSINEIAYLSILEKMSLFIQSVIKRRKVASKRASTLPDTTDLDISKFDSENTGLISLLSVFSDIKRIHTDMQKCLIENSRIGPALLMFSDQIVKPLISFSCMMASAGGVGDILREYRDHSLSVDEIFDEEEMMGQMRAYDGLLKEVCGACSGKKWGGDGMVVNMARIKIRAFEGVLRGKLFLE